MTQDSSGTIEYDELTEVMKKLGSSCQAAEIKDVFVVSDAVSCYPNQLASRNSYRILTL